MTDRNTVKIDLVIKRISGEFKSTFNSRYMKTIADFLAEQIRIRTRLGYGVQGPGQRRERLKPLSEKYIKQRQRDKKKGKLSNETTPKRSNLTRTGQLLDALRGIGEQARARITVNNRRDDGERNDDIIVEQELKGRPFLYLTDAEYRKAKQKIREDLIKNMQRIKFK